MRSFFTDDNEALTTWFSYYFVEEDAYAVAGSKSKSFLLPLFTFLPGDSCYYKSVCYGSGLGWMALFVRIRLFLA